MTRKRSKTGSGRTPKVPAGRERGPSRSAEVRSQGRPRERRGVAAALEPEQRETDGIQLLSLEPSGPTGSKEPTGLFPVVGIGASAGGLEALETFLKNVPDHSGMAFVVIQHLDPTHKGALVELLQRFTAMPVVQVNDRLQVEPDTVYVIPPNKDMSILHGNLHLLPQASPRGLNLPIDYFFRSLADDRQEGSIGVVLSGMGSDGTLGLRAIKEKAGAGFVQSLSSAKFDGMPRSAIDAGLADVVAPPEELPARILAYHRRAPYQSREEAPLEEKQQSALEKVFVLLRAQTGSDFSLYKRSTVYRRIERRMGLHQIDKLATYVRYLRENPTETDLLFKELLIGVTNFFRDPPAWEHLRDKVLPKLLKSRSQGVLRAWVPGCSTGEEAYSLAIIFREALDKLPPPRGLTLQIFATDLDKEAIETARQGSYPANIVADASPDRLHRFFVQSDRGYRVAKEIREMVVFAPQNIIMDPPFTKLDILACRNLLIYLSPELQKRLIPLFHYILNPGGLLFLGTAETVGGFSTLFAPVDGKTRIYRRIEGVLGGPAIEFPAPYAPAPPPHNEPRRDGADLVKSPPPNLQVLADRLIAQQFAPAAILINDKGDILYISGRTGKYLEPAVGKANLNIFAMAREGLRYELSNAVATALKQDRSVVVQRIKVRTNGSQQVVDLTVQKLTEPKTLRGSLIIVIADVPAEREPAPVAVRPPRANIRLKDLEDEIQQAREEAQTIREEMQTSQEELKSTNEELQSTNEELQSTNEELTTSKEEMQSMNEELQTVNHELQSKVEELSRSNNDMKNLLNSTDVATLFLDDELLVRRFTTQAAKIIKLIPSDTGRPITDVTTELDYPNLAEDAREVLRTLVFKETQVSAKDGRWFMVRIMPYRTLENVIEGVVITFVDVTATRRLEVTLREQANQARQIGESWPSMAWGCRPDGACDFLSRQWVEYTGIPESDQLGYGWLDRVHPDDRERLRTGWKAAIDSRALLDTEIRIGAKDGTYRWFRTRLAPIRDGQGHVVKWYGSHTDIDELKKAKLELAESFSRVLDWISEPLFVLDESLAIRCFNSAAERTLGYSSEQLLGKSFLDIYPDARPGFAEKVGESRRAGTEMSLELKLDRSPNPGSYNALVHPRPGGVSVLLKRVSPSPQGP